jgi:hypothetical protein
MAGGVEFSFSLFDPNVHTTSDPRDNPVLILKDRSGGSLFWRNNVFTRARYPMPKQNHLQKSNITNMTPSPSHLGGTGLRNYAAAMRYVHRSVLPRQITYRFGGHFDVYADSVHGLLADAIVVCVGGLPDWFDSGTGVWVLYSLRVEIARLARA